MRDRDTSNRVEGTERDVPTTVYRWARRRENLSLVLIDFGVVTAAWLLGFAAGFEAEIPAEVQSRALVVVGPPVVVQLGVNRVAGLYGAVWRHASIDEAVRVVAAVLAGVTASFGWLALLGGVSSLVLPISTAPPVAALLMLIGCGGVRFQARLFALERQRTRSEKPVHALIVGAGSAGAALAHELTHTPSGRDIHIVGFIDDDALLHRRSVRGHRVIGNTDDLEELCRRHQVNRLFVAMPSVDRERTKQIIDRALRTDAQVKVLRPSADPASGMLHNVRDLDLSDLLGRQPAPVNTDGIGGYLRGATVLVTGAGGSIGSEIARQVARYQPGRLLLLDRDETLLHDVASGDVGDAEIVLLDLRDRERVAALLERTRPEVVFHAAAHKHVPILEHHAEQAATVNVLSTWWLAEATARTGCKHFVCLSTDKAADPCSVMGATKRAAEHIVVGVGEHHNLPYAAVRFGNVLGSRGSVVPTFLRQILDGGPVTVTSEEMTRYFMTVPEAVSLVLQAGAMADGGRIFLLDMGEPASILGLARQMIRLAGLRPHDDIPIEITGVRPGERLHEQLRDDAEVSEPADHPSISVLRPKRTLDWHALEQAVAAIERACHQDDDAVRRAVADMLRRCGVESGIDAGVPLRPVASATNNGSAGTQPAETVTGRGDEVAGRAAALVVSSNGNGNGNRSAMSEVDGNGTSGTARDRHDGVGPASRRPLALLAGRRPDPGALPFARPARPELERVVQRLTPSYDSGIVTNGRLVRELEERMAGRLSVGHVVAVSSCTSGLMLVVQALVEGRPGSVVMPSFTFSASAHAVAWNGRSPRFVDCDPYTFQADPVEVEAALDGAAAIMATHVFGAPCRPGTFEKLAAAAGVPVMFDAAHALGATCHDRPIGGFGAAEVFSLTPTKPMVAGEGGLVATDDGDLADRLRMGRDYGNPGDYDTRFVGLNARMSEFHAAMALESLEMFDSTLDRRRQIAERYVAELSAVPGIRTQAVPVSDVSTYKDFTVVVEADEFGLDRDGLTSVLSSEGIDTRTYFDPPVHRQRAYRHEPQVCLPTTDAVSSSVVSLPIYPDLSAEDVDRVVEVIRLAHEQAPELTKAAAQRQT